MQDYKLILNNYDNVDGIPDGWVKSALTVTQLKNNAIPHYKACIGMDGYSCHYKPILVNIIPTDFTKIENDDCNLLADKKQQTSKKIQNMTINLDILGECLYSINKEAKRQRDMQSHQAVNIWGSGDVYSKGLAHHNLHQRKYKKETLYQLKDKVVKAVIADYNVTPLGYHLINGIKMDLLRFGDHEFHIKQNNSNIHLGEIETLISSTRKKSTPPKKAEMILKQYLSNRAQNSKKIMLGVGKKLLKNKR